MIYYHSNRFFRIIFSLEGSVIYGSPRLLARAVAMTAFSALAAILFSYSPVVADILESAFLQKILSFVSVFVGLLVSFRLNTAFSQWRTGLTTLDQYFKTMRDLVGEACFAVDVGYIERVKKLKEKEKEALAKEQKEISSSVTQVDSNANITDGTSQTAITPPAELATKNVNQTVPAIQHQASTHDCTITEAEQAVKDATAFLLELRRIVACHGTMVTHHLRRQSIQVKKLAEIGLLSEEELATFEDVESQDAHGLLPHQALANKVKKHLIPKIYTSTLELHLRRLLCRQQSNEVMAAMHVNGLNAKISQLSSDFQSAQTLGHYPIPFCYAQFVKLVIFLYLTLYSLSSLHEIYSLTPFAVFLWSLLLLSADEIANEIECPFGTDNNDIDLDYKLTVVEREITALLIQELRSLGATATEFRDSLAFYTTKTSFWNVEAASSKGTAPSAFWPFLRKRTRAATTDSSSDSPAVPTASGTRAHETTPLLIP